MMGTMTTSTKGKDEFVTRPACQKNVKKYNPVCYLQ